MNKIDLAYEVCKDAHNNWHPSGKPQTRSWSDELYFNHPLRVADQLTSLKGSLEMVCAAALHDVLEDTTYPKEKILEQFGLEITELVSELTKPKFPAKTPRCEKKKQEYLLYAQMSNAAKIIKMADRFDNLKDADKVPIKFMNKYMEESNILLYICYHAHPLFAEKLLERIKTWENMQTTLLPQTKE